MDLAVIDPQIRTARHPTSSSHRRRHTSILKPRNYAGFVRYAVVCLPLKT